MADKQDKCPKNEKTGEHLWKGHHAYMYPNNAYTCELCGATGYFDKSVKAVVAGAHRPHDKEPEARIA